MGDGPSVTEVADALEFSGDEAFFLRLVAGEQTAWGDVKGAVGWAGSVVDPYERASALVGLAEGIIGRIREEQWFAAAPSASRAPTGPLRNMEPSWSPDGTQIALLGRQPRRSLANLT